MDVFAIVALLVVVGFVVLVVLIAIKTPQAQQASNIERGEKLFGAEQFTLEPKAAGSDTVISGRYRDDELCVYFDAIREGKARHTYTFVARPAAASWVVVQIVRRRFLNHWADTRLDEVKSGQPEIDKALVVRTGDSARAAALLRQPAILRALDIVRSDDAFTELLSNGWDPRAAPPDQQSRPPLLRVVLSRDDPSPERIAGAVEVIDLFRQALSADTA